MQTEVKEKPRYALVASVQLPDVSDIEFEASLTELSELAKTLGFQVVGTFVQKRNSFDRTAYMGVGKLEEISMFVNRGLRNDELDDAPPVLDAGTVEIDALLVDHEISPSQARNLELAVGCEVMDRTMVILEIFHRNARSIAARPRWKSRVCYMAPRLREAGWPARKAGSAAAWADAAPANRIPSWTGARCATASPSCSAKSSRWSWSARLSARAGLSVRAGPGRVSLVGYTNAGKSTLMRALTGSEVLVANKLFATLTPRCAPSTRKARRGCWSVIPSVSSRTCLTVWWLRSSPRWKRRWTRPCCCT